MFGRRAFAGRYFAARYFGDGGAAPIGTACMFGRRYFPVRYFGRTYFGVATTSGGVAVFPDPSDVAFGVVYGPNGNDYTGIRAGGGGAYIRRR